MSNQHILVVDDQALVRRSVAKAARMLGFQPVEAVSVREARFVLAQQQLAIVVADHDLMDGTNGLDVLTSVQREQPSALRVLMSGNPPPGLESALSSGLVHRFVLKPFGLDELRMCLEAPRDA